jgi:hypothetical protein
MAVDTSKAIYIINQLNIAPETTDEELYSALKAENCSDDEIKQAITFFRDNSNTKSKLLASYHKVMSSDEALTPSEISTLLGIEVDVEDNHVVAEMKRQSGIFQTIIIAVCSVLLAVALLAFMMYINGLWPGYGSSNN